MSNNNRFLMLFQHKINLRIYACFVYLDFHPRKEGLSYLKGAYGCVNTNIYKKCLSNIFKLFSKKQCFEKSHLNTTAEDPVDTNPHFLESGIYIGATACKNLANIKKQ